MSTNWNSSKNSGHPCLGELSGWWTQMGWEGDVMGRTQKLCIWNPPRPCPLCLFNCLVLYHKTASVSVPFLSSVRNPRELWNLRGSCKPSECVASWSEVQVARGPLSLWLVSEVRQSCWGGGSGSLTCGVCANSRWLVLEFHGSTAPAKPH